ncbi:MAG: AI-2E family transporter [Flavobacteriaceae bacterium]|nr:AI-2E family transporter [Flavobacteriaceae bacterium]
MAEKNYLYRAVAFVLFIAISLLLLVEGKSFLAPLTLAAILSLLILPVAQKLEHFKLNRTLASLSSTLILFIISCGFFVLVTAQMNEMVEKWGAMKDVIKPKVEMATQFITQNTPVTEKKLEGYKSKITNFKFIGTANGGSGALTYLGKLIGFLGMYLLGFIYVFFMLRFRTKFKKFLLKFFSKEKNKEVKKTIRQTISVAQGYLLGKLKLIAILALIYGIGLGISGVSNFILIALIAAALTIIPYLGNIMGYSLALIFGYLIDGELGILIGVTITFVVSQFVESYILQPYVVGKDVDLNPLFVILAVILGNMIWGIIGMVVAIPVLGIINVIFLHVPSLKPFGFLMSRETDKN